jgi:flagellar basal-body rod protein FlgG
LGFVEFGPDRRAVLKQGDSLFYPQEGAQPQPATGSIEQGVLERSNSNVVNEMVELINNYRIYEANSRAVTTQDQMLDHSVNEVGRL